MKRFILTSIFAVYGLSTMPVLAAEIAHRPRPEIVKAQLVKVRDSFAKTSDSQWQALLPKAQAKLTADRHPEIAAALGELSSPVRRALLQQRLNLMIKEQNQLGILLLIDLMADMLDTGYDSDTMYSKSCEWASASQFSCIAYWTFVVLTLDGQEMSLE